MTTLLNVARQLEHLSARLAAKVRPGHVEYISKQDAASALASIASACALTAVAQYASNSWEGPEPIDHAEPETIQMDLENKARLVEGME